MCSSRAGLDPFRSAPGACRQGWATMPCTQVRSRPDKSQPARLRFIASHSTCRAVCSSAEAGAAPLETCTSLGHHVLHVCLNETGSLPPRAHVACQPALCAPRRVRQPCGPVALLFIERLCIDTCLRACCLQDLATVYIRVVCQPARSELARPRACAVRFMACCKV